MNGSVAPDDTQGTSMEVALSTENSRLALWDFLFEVSPLPRQLERSFNCLSSSVHGKHHVVAKDLTSALLSTFLLDQEGLNILHEQVWRTCQMSNYGKPSKTK